MLPDSTKEMKMVKPCIQTTAAPRRKVTRPWLVSTIALSAVALIVLMRRPQCFLCEPVFQPWRCRPFASPTIGDSSRSLSALEAILLSEPNESRAADWSYYFTSQSRLAGEGKAQGLWVQKKWQEFGIPETNIIEYNTPVDRPVFQRLALINTETGSPSVMYEAKLMEELPVDDPSKVRVPAYHGGSASGNVTAQFVYANFGTNQDYDDLEVQNHIDIKGKIAIIKYGKEHRGDKMFTAARRGLVGILMYADPQQDGNITEAHGYKGYPDGPARPETCIERGAVNAVNGGDPGIPTLPTIPSLPVSFGDIIPLLKALHGCGPKAADTGSDWHGGGLYYKGVEYHVGPSPSHIVLNLNNQMSVSTVPLYQTFGTIKGTTEETIIIGHHRDAWGTGAGDSASAAAALMEVARSFAIAYKTGWRPRRTLIFVSWEGEEIGHGGVEPWVVSNLSWLQKTVVAYLHVSVAAAGPQFQVKATPIMQEVVHRAAKVVPSPDPEGGTVFDRWGGEVIGAGTGDTNPFLQIACVSTFDFSFGATYWPYHSNFDTFAWMNTTGDPGWKYHVTTAKLWALTAAYLSESPILPIRAADYSAAMRKYAKNIRESIPGSVSFDIGPLDNAIEEFHNASVTFDAYASSLSSVETDGMHAAIRRINKKYINLERQFCYKQEHLIYDTSSFYLKLPGFPHLLKSILSGNSEEAREWMDIIQGRITNAADLLKL
ncbi:hypothetical protein TWF694_008208 [Orbilia ellipsospora]|uniref:Glutamate carboxypeptidase n=1 Tax=Orbilia ellipsospora TaxID=2528407 RepID=A0AAV9XFD7_9PEZI